jgi:hypothetical protein
MLGDKSRHLAIKITVGLQIALLTSCQLVVANFRLDSAIFCV